MQNSAYNIYNASAGSGKTFTLAKSYLKILVAAKNYDLFKSILALTFTNKAVGEMKERIIDMLKYFSSKENLKTPNAMFNAICDELSVSPEFLHKKSEQILKHIIHNYGAFDISTIDGFTHRVIRTFAYDLKLPVNFEVELDQDRLLNEAVDSLIAKAGSDEALTKTLIDFAIEKADDDKSWDISFDFNKIAKLLVNENDLPFINELKDKSLDDFKQLKLQLAKDIKAIEDAIVKKANDILTLINECGLQFDDFNRKSLPKHFENLHNKVFSINFESNWQNDLVEGNTLYPKRVTDSIASTIDSIQPTLAEAFTETKILVFKLKLKKAFYKNITPLSVLNAIQQELNMLKEEQNKMLISEFNSIISKEIKDQPTPFIYERLGEKFKHYFIDEFQDTSKMQWENIVPLLDNALSATNGSAMLVGDAKQAIYRWRGGEAEQFINLYNETENPFQIQPNVLTLDTNYRSAKEIISFNNSFFEFLGDNYFSFSDYANLYKNASQNQFSKSEGYVNLKFLEFSKEDDINEIYASQVLETIKECQKNGFILDDICVLVRKRKEGVAIANYLSENGIKITSSETLLLKNSEKINFMTAFLKLLLQPNNNNLKIEILSFLAIQHQVKDIHQFYITHYKDSLDETLNSLKSLNIFINSDQLFQLSLYDLVEHLVRVFNLNDTSDAYLQFYLDVVLEFTQKQNSDIAAFVSYFEKKQDSLSVISPQNKDAVEIMTIHKSKGLEFPVVIFPFADLNIYKELDPKVWFPTEESIQDFNNLLINYTKDVEHFGDNGKLIYDNHQSQLELDNINLLYVALTRAVEQLYIISKKDINSKGIVNANTYSGMFIKYLQHTNQWSENIMTYSFGEPLQQKSNLKKTEDSIPLKFISTPKEEHNLSIITKAGLLWDTQQEKAIERGNLVHLILSKIKTVEDVDFALNDVLTSGEIKQEQLQQLKTLVHNVIEHPQLSAYFKDNDYKVYNERDIITNSGQLIRPDRLNINANNEAIIIDYKTGNPEQKHGLQLHTYESILNTMGYKTIKKILIYINDTVECIEI